ENETAPDLNHPCLAALWPLSRKGLQGFGTETRLEVSPSNRRASRFLRSPTNYRRPLAPGHAAGQAGLLGKDCVQRALPGVHSIGVSAVEVTRDLRRISAARTVP